MTRALALIALIAGGCGFDAEIVLLLQTDIGPDRQGSVELLVATPAEADPVRQRCVCVGGTCPDGSPPRALPLSASLRPGTQGDVPFRIYARGYADGACGVPAIVEAKAKVRFTRGTSRQLSMVLSAACANVVCAATQTCDPSTGQCVDDSTELPPVDPTLDFAVPRGDAAMPVDLATPPDLATLPQRFQIAGDGASAIAVTAVGSAFDVTWTSGAMTPDSAGGLHVVSVGADGTVGTPDVAAAPGGFASLGDGLCAAAAGTDQIFVTSLDTSTDGKSQLWGEIISGPVLLGPTTFEASLDASSALRCQGGGGREVLGWITNASATVRNSVWGKVRYPGGSDVSTRLVDDINGNAAANVALATRGPGGPVTGESLLAYTWKKVGGSGVSLTVLTLDDALTVLGTSTRDTTGNAVAATYGPKGATLAHQHVSTGALVAGVLGEMEYTVSPVGRIDAEGLALAPSGSGLFVAWIDGASATLDLYATKLEASGIPGSATMLLPMASQVTRIAAATNVDGVTLLVWQEQSTGGAGQTTTALLGRLVAPSP